ncbi:MAG: GAF domain-containing protein [Gemmatimonadetes bacterium]|nr:GAF domain-containing protein [Gemmatimonadota bacterium]
MKRTAVVERIPVPHAVAVLLDRYRSAPGTAEVRLWAETAAGRACLYPEAAGAEPWAGSAHYPIEPLDGVPLELELRRASRQGRFLAQVLSQLVTQEMDARSAARELSERYEEINLLYFISEVLGSMLSLPEAATRILSEVADVLGARRATLWVHDAEADRLQLAAAVGDDGVRGSLPVNAPESATALVFRERQPLNLERGALRPSAARLEPPPRRSEAFLSVPVNYTPPQGTARTVGVITLVGRRSNVRFSAGDARLLAAIASQIGAALETQRLLRESLRQERLVRELELAHDLQLKLLPDPGSFQAPPDVAARCAPAESVGGDFYNLFRLSHDRLGIMIGDVSSHGFSAALIMALTSSAVAIYAQDANPPAEVLRRVHRALAKELESTEMYLTLFYGVVDRRVGTLVYANAGHPHAFRVSADGRAERLGATDLPLGMMPHDRYGEGTTGWAATDLICLFTDGLSDAYPARAGRAGEQALVADLVRLRARPLPEILTELFGATERVVLTVPPDDRTMLLVRG